MTSLNIKKINAVELPQKLTNESFKSLTRIENVVKSMQTSCIWIILELSPLSLANIVCLMVNHGEYSY